MSLSLTCSSVTPRSMSRMDSRCRVTRSSSRLSRRLEARRYSMVPESRTAMALTVLPNGCFPWLSQIWLSLLTKQKYVSFGDLPAPDSKSGSVVALGFPW